MPSGAGAAMARTTKATLPNAAKPRRAPRHNQGSRAAPVPAGPVRSSPVSSTCGRGGSPGTTTATTHSATIMMKYSDSERVEKKNAIDGKMNVARHSR